MLKYLLSLPKKIIRELVKFTRETLQGSDGKYSSKQAIISQSFNLCQAAFIYQIIVTGSVDREMFNSFLLCAFSTTVVSSGSNLLHQKIDNPTVEQPNITISDPNTTNINIANKENS